MIALIFVAIIAVANAQYGISRYGKVAIAAPGIQQYGAIQKVAAYAHPAAHFGGIGFGAHGPHNDAYGHAAHNARFQYTFLKGADLANQQFAHEGALGQQFAIAPPQYAGVGVHHPHAYGAVGVHSPHAYGAVGVHSPHAYGAVVKTVEAINPYAGAYQKVGKVYANQDLIAS